MQINPLERQKLTESKYFKVEIGQKYTLELKNWRYSEERFKESTELKPVLVFDVEMINNTMVTVKKEFRSTNRSNNVVFLDIIDRAEKSGRDSIIVTVFRIDRDHWNIEDLSTKIEWRR